LLLALPLLLIFGGLFMSADAVFQHFVLTLFRLDLQSLLTHLLIIGVVTWLVAGALRGMLGAEEFVLPESTPARTFSLGSTEICVVLGLLDVLFFGFVLVQLRYLFGGAALVASTTGLSYAQYARRGFFELVTVAAVALPLLLLVHWLLPADAPRSERRFRALAGTQVVLLFVIMASALQRMRLYQSAYGLTELRLYTTAFMVWLSLVFLWFVATVLRGRRERFVFGALVAGFVVIGALHILDPDAYIVRVNVARADRRFDADYATSLSADAVPALIAALPDLKPQARALVTAHLRARWSPPRSADWRTWNLARAQAWQAVRASGLRQ
jgi:hypothetical protein